MPAIYRREFKSFFLTPSGYVFVAAVYFFGAYYFFINNLVRNTTDMGEVFDRLFSVVLFLVPILTMRLLSEERRTGTQQLLLTAPVSRLGIVLGKYLAALTVYLLGISVTLLCALVMETASSPDWPVIWGNVAGLALLGASLIGICLFLSSVTESQVVAAVAGFGAGLFLILADALVYALNSPLLRRIMPYISFQGRYRGFTQGILDFSDAVFFLGIAAFFVFLTTLLMEKWGWNLYFALAVLGGACVLVLSCALAQRLTDRLSLSADLTEGGVYRTGAQTEAVLGSLTQDVGIDVLATRQQLAESAYLSQVDRILEWYPRLSGRVSLRYIDTGSDPSYAASHSDLRLSEGDILVTVGAQTRQLSMANLFNYAYTASGSLTPVSSRAEEAVTGAIADLLTGNRVRLGVLTGNGEADCPEFVALLANNSYTCESVVPSTADLSAYDALALFAPVTDLSEDDVRALDAYLYAGGAYGKTLFYFASATQGELPRLEAFVREWGVEIGQGAVFESDSSRTYQYQPFYPLADFAGGGYEAKLTDASAPMLLPLSRPLGVLFAARDAYTTQTLLTFAASAALRPADAPTDFSAADATRWGPFPAMVLCTRTGPAGTAPTAASAVTPNAAAPASAEASSAPAPVDASSAPASVGASSAASAGSTGSGSAQGDTSGAGMASTAPAAATPPRSHLVVAASTEMLGALSIQNTSLADGEYLLALWNSLTDRGSFVAIPPKSLSGKTLGLTTGQVSLLGSILGGVIPIGILLAGAFVWFYRRNG
ncbi:MAG: Gldg family protein [Lachnospiraceae bacterium]|jgi:ABC-2 type transport system permease protein|nr:Gldg family protein [Lachnospiraceae bacterium]